MGLTTHPPPLLRKHRDPSHLQGSTGSFPKPNTPSHHPAAPPPRTGQRSTACRPADTPASAHTARKLTRAQSDLPVLATPVYVDGMTGPLKIFLDRLVPLLEGRIEIRDDHRRHPLREGVKAGKLVQVSASGFTEMNNFDPLVAHVKTACRNMGR